jgi:hypothetical protein
MEFNIEINRDYWNEESSSKINYNGVSSRNYKENYENLKRDEENSTVTNKNGIKYIKIEETSNFENSKRGIAFIYYIYFSKGCEIGRQSRRKNRYSKKIPK